MDQLYGTIPAVPSIYDACQPNRKGRVRLQRLNFVGPKFRPLEGGKEQLGETSYGQAISLRRASTRLECLPASSARPRAASTSIRDETLRTDPISIAFLRII
jgi:hypothetical protein